MSSASATALKAGLMGPEGSTAVLASQPPALLPPPLANWCSSSLSSVLPGVHSTWDSDGLSTCLLRDFLDLSQDSPQPVYPILTHLLSPGEQAIQMCLSSDSQDQHGFVSHLSPAPPLFSQSATESQCYGIVLNYLIFFINPSRSDLALTSLSIIHFIDTLIKSEVGRIKC